MITKIAKVKNLNSGKNTARVEVETKKQHPKYDKLIKSHKSYVVHIEEKDKKNFEIGDDVEIQQVAPISKKKVWKIISKKN